MIDTDRTERQGTPTGAQLSYDNEWRLSGWQNTPSSPTTSDSFLYDGVGNRVEQAVTVNGSITTTTTYVAGGLEEVTDNGTSTTLTKYFTGADGLPTAERVGTNGPLSYLATDGQGTISEALDSAGTVTSNHLYTPYGVARYSSGTSPTTLGYTGQRADSATGLDYYRARYYDPVAGQFVSADTVADGLNRYGYVHGNPTTATDPTGHRMDALHDDYGCAECDFDVDNVFVRHHECPDPGCAYANGRRAVVGHGALKQKASDTRPRVYSWGSTQNGANLSGFSGKNLQNLIQLLEALRKSLQAFLDHDEQIGAPLIDLASAFVAALVTGKLCLQGECDGETFDAMKDQANEAGTSLEQLAVLE